MRTRIRENAVRGLLFAAVVVGGIATGTVVSSASTDPKEGDDPRYAVTRGTEVIEGHVKDPRGQAPWAVRRYRGQTGLDCIDAGQARNGSFGRATTGKFTASEGLPTGLCAPLADAPDGAIVAFRQVAQEPGATSPDTSILYGVAEPNVRRVIARDSGGTRTLDVGARGTFMTVYTGVRGFSDVEVSFEYADGTKKTVPKKPRVDTTR
jgi:hypothetical protein